MHRARGLAAGTLVLASLVTPAHAHHVMDGALPRTALDAFLAGVGHPIIGLDHLAFVIGAGLMSALAGATLWLPLAFVAATLLGATFHLFGAALPFAEGVIAISVLLVAVGIYRQEVLDRGVLVAGFVVAGIAHGYAYGESIIGAEAAPLGTYLIGFALVQWVIAWASSQALFRALRISRQWARGGMRLAGIVTGAVGAIAALSAAGVL